MIVILNLVIVLACLAIAAILVNAHAYPAAFAYSGFALGYVGLAWLYWSITV
jgi:hypothetical protein